ncbi:tank [Carabus blaptoides fortunei]
MDNLKGIGYAVYRGLIDSIRGTYTLFYLDKEINQRTRSRLSPTKSHSTPSRRNNENNEGSHTRMLKEHEESKVLKRVFQCCALNGGVFLSSILLFYYLLLPSLKFILLFTLGDDSGMGKFVWSWMRPVLSFVFEAVWVLPLFLLSKVVNSLWFQDIADSAYRYSCGRPQFMQSLSKLIADSLFSILVQALFLLQALVVNWIPLVMLGDILCLVHMCMLYSLYAFEYKWFNMGWELHKRLTFIENNWPYFIGFGLPLAVLTQMSTNWVISGCIFSVLFPLFIISGNEANPVTDICYYPLQLFSPVVAISNTMFNKTIGQAPVHGAQSRR